MNIKSTYKKHPNATLCTLTLLVVLSVIATVAVFVAVPAVGLISLIGVPVILISACIYSVLEDALEGKLK